jgi:hypothetical protein
MKFPQSLWQYSLVLSLPRQYNCILKLHNGRKWLYGNPVSNTTNADLTSPVTLSVLSHVHRQLYFKYLHQYNTKGNPQDNILNWMVICRNMLLKCKYTLFYVWNLVKYFTLVLLMPEPCIRMGWKNTVSPFSIASDTKGWSSNPSTRWNALLTVCWNVSTQVIDN